MAIRQPAHEENSALALTTSGINPSDITGEYCTDYEVCKVFPVLLLRIGIHDPEGVPGTSPKARTGGTAATGHKAPNRNLTGFFAEDWSPRPAMLLIIL